MLAQRLHVADLEAGPLQFADGAADRGQFAVGKDVGVDELVHPVGLFVRLRGAGDLMVQQPPAGAQQGVQGAGVVPVAVRSDVFGHPDGGNGVIGAVLDVPVVLDPQLDEVGQALFRDPLAAVRGLLPGERDAGDLDAVLAGGVQRHGAPAAADVQQAVSGLQGEFAADQVELVALGLLQGGAGAPVGAGVHHRRPQHVAVEVVADVVVVADCLSVAALAVPLTVLQGGFLGGRRGRRQGPGEGDQLAYGGPVSGLPEQPGGLRQGERAGPPRAAREAAQGPERPGPAGGRQRPALRVPFPQQARHLLQQGEQVSLDGQFPRHPRAGQPQLAGLPQHPPHGAAVLDHEYGTGGRARLGAVPGPDAHRQRGTQQCLGNSGQPRRGVRHGAPPQKLRPIGLPILGAGYAEGAARTTDGGRPLRVVQVVQRCRPASEACLVTPGQDALAFSAGAAAAAGAGAGLAAS